MSTFFGIEIGRRGINAHQRALETTGHNVANASTPGYSRQQVVLATTPPYSYPGMGAGQRGTGVQAQSVRRIRESFLDYQYRNEVKALGRWQLRQDTLEKLEAILNEPSDQGLSTLIDRFFDAWQNLARYPDTEGARSALRQEALALTDAFNHLADQIKDLKADLNSSIAVRVNEINSLAHQIRDLNSQIVKAEAGGMAANDLRDRRDLLLDQLAEVVPIQVEEDRFGAVSIVVRDHTLLTGQKINDLSADAASGKVEWPDGAGYRPGSQPYGALEGLLEAVRIEEDGEDKNPGLVQIYEQRLNNLAKNIADAVNKLHSEGVGLDGATGLDFFVVLGSTSENNENDGITAGTISINSELLGPENLDKIAAASQAYEGENEKGEPIPIYGEGKPPPAGDGSKALAIAQLRHALTMGDRVTFNDYYNSLVAELGVQGQEAQRMVDNQIVLTGEIDNRRLSVSGVNLDEEITDMIRLQQAYNASARIITTVDEMLEVLINRTGLVGR
ncbi:MAG TPA: flagellar hook-associated protein FlgK [bacterium]|nr:flagellar hook-associated protein FlgK [bacterium]